MKMDQVTFETLKTTIQVHLEKNPDLVTKYETGNFPRSEKVKDLQTRFNFDLFYATQSNQIVPPELMDDHLATALKHICPKVTRKY